MTQAIATLDVVDVQRLREALIAGIHRVIARRDFINKINVFPVPDSDTGTNLAFTLHAVARGEGDAPTEHVGQYLAEVADRALDGARGNSGAIFAQYLQGFSEAVETQTVLRASHVAEAAFAGSQSAQGAIAEPREGTMLSVIRDHAHALREQIAADVTDLKSVLRHGLEQARKSLARTPEQLDVLKQAGVVDAGGQGFVDWLEGIQEYLETGVRKVIEFAGDQSGQVDVGHQVGEQPQHRFCTECLVTGEAIDRNALRDRLTAIESSSLVIAGTKHKVRVHIHVDNPAAAFVICEDFGAISGQKADDMLRQTHAAHGARQKVAIVTDTAADIPDSELERLDIHVVPLRVNFGERQYLDKVSLTPTEFYELMASESEHPKTSQPPAGDYRRLFEFLGSHYESVLSISVSSALSGTWQAADSARKRVEKDIFTWDSLNGTVGQGLLTMYAAEAAQQGFDRQQIVQMLEHLKPQTKVHVVLDDLQYVVRGGRLKPSVKRATDFLRVIPVLGNSAEGTLKPQGAVFGRRNLVSKMTRWVARRYQAPASYRLLIGHCNDQVNARKLRDELVGRLNSVHSTYLTEVGPVVGTHGGPGALFVALQPYTAPDDLAEELFGLEIADDSADGATQADG